MNILETVVIVHFTATDIMNLLTRHHLYVMYISFTKKASLKYNQLYLLHSMLLDSVTTITKYVIMNTMIVVMQNKFALCYDSKDIIFLVFHLIYMTIISLFLIHGQVDMNKKR